MAPEETRLTLIEYLSETEEAIARLYEAYSNTQPEHEEFWFGKVIQEADHSSHIHELIHKLKNGSATFTVDAAMTDAIHKLDEFLERELKRTKVENMSFTDALEVAIQIEKSVAKQGFYSFLKNPSGNINETIQRLRHDDAGHVKFLERELEKYREGT